MSVLVGVDLGGTNIRAAVATGSYTHETPVHEPTPAHDGPEAVVEAIGQCVERAAAGRTVSGIGIGIPGPLDPRTGRVYAAPQLRGWENVEAGEMLRQRLGCDVAANNDANLAGYAEWLAGAGRGSVDFVFITASTGVGGALVLNGQLYAGRSGTAGEVGHMALGEEYPPCAQGHRGCLEGTSSGTGIANAARRAIAAGETTSMSALDPACIDAKVVEDAARDGDAVAQRIWTFAAHTLGRSIGGIINLFSPEVVAVGGGLILAGDLLFEPLRAAIGELAFAVPASHCRVEPAVLGTDAGLVGAVAWAVSQLGHAAGVPQTEAS